MSKAVLVIDMPVACIDCPCHFAHEDGTIECGVRGMELLTDDIESFKYEDCPLLELPEKTDYPPISENSYAAGYNDCIDEITEGKKPWIKRD